MLTHMNTLQELTQAGWSRPVVDQSLSFLRKAESSYQIDLRVYLRDLFLPRILLLMSELDEPTLRLLWHRYKAIKLEDMAVEALLQTITEFLNLYQDLHFEKITKLLQETTRKLDPAIQGFALIVMENYRRNLFKQVAKVYSRINSKKLAELFGLKDIKQIQDLGLEVKDEGEFTSIEESKNYQGENNIKLCQVQMRILQSVVGHMERVGNTK